MLIDDKSKNILYVLLIFINKTGLHKKLLQRITPQSSYLYHIGLITPNLCALPNGIPPEPQRY